MSGVVGYTADNQAFTRIYTYFYSYKKVQKKKNITYGLNSYVILPKMDFFMKTVSAKLKFIFSLLDFVFSILIYFILLVI